MFTGIVQTKAEISQIRDLNGIRRLTVQAGAAHLQQLTRGASIAINGVCLTATEFDAAAGWVCFDVIAESLQKTNLGDLVVGSWVNLERSLRFGDELGGHIVSGHIQATATLSAIHRDADNVGFELSVPAELLPYIQPKGFIAVEGCSLTVGEVTAQGFSLYLIPETLQITNLGTKQVGDKLNIELDQQTVTIIRTVERLLAERFAKAID
ncbi:riboflavin synthase subunit alpha [Alishewanella sp. BS5-314]|uniref:riboflavin synthase subunit alpha n=1 Tax=Alishewanella sp. BS5-314 TaxID=2755587 RepID=UPI0021BB5721|nr:riboflavin synthase subunit alpha [Alishewanella sp. BS5-314]MCT8125716.1 riboflavin synthase subunit alpha [Alishewanella sp. BS5-314]